jgi:hypothetical protein
LDGLVVFFFFVAVWVVPVGGVVEAPCGGGGLAPWASTNEVQFMSIAPIAIALSIVIDRLPIILLATRTCRMFPKNETNYLQFDDPLWATASDLRKPELFGPHPVNYKPTT